jgi:hypothetical protein
MLERLRNIAGRADEPVTINEPGWEREDFGVTHFRPVHLINNIWQRAVAQLFGWDYSSRMRRRVAVDAQGRLVVVTGGVSAYTPQIYQVTIDTTPIRVFQAREGRLFVILNNQGASDVWLGLTSGVSSSNGFRLSPGQMLQLDSWTSELWAVSLATGTTLGIIEG